MKLNNFEIIDELMQTGVYPASSLTSKDIKMTKYFFSQPDVCRAAINLYRNIFMMTLNEWRQFGQKIDVPVLVIWGDRDRHLLTSLCDNL